MTPKEKYNIEHNITQEPVCYCGNPLKFYGKRRGYRKYCSIKCSTNSIETKAKRERTNLKKYGAKNPFQSDKIKKKIVETNLKKYGVEHIRQLDFFKEKYEKTCIEKYGVTNPNKLESVKDKKRETSLKNYGVDHPSKNKKYKTEANRKLSERKYKRILRYKDVTPLFSLEEYNNNGGSGYYDLKYKWLCKKCNREFFDHVFSHVPVCQYCYQPLKGTSKGEQDIQQWISEKIEIQRNRTFSHEDQKYEIDIFIPSHNIGIEFNGLYWHSEHAGKPKTYHIDKSKWFFDNFGISLIHVFETEWIKKSEIVKSIILNRLGLNKKKIYARLCKMSEISSEDYKNFLDENHIQGGINSKFRYGLYFKNELVSVMGFGASRYEKDKIELHRFANKLDSAVVGGFSKLLKYANFDNVITYCDLRYFSGVGYLKNGFIEVDRTKPNYWYFKSKFKMFNRLSFQKHKLVDKLEVFDEELTEWENMSNNGWNRIYDCGNIKLSYDKTS